jgi:hypothetical protein
MISDIDIHVLYLESFNNMVETLQSASVTKFVTLLIRHPLRLKSATSLIRFGLSYRIAIPVQQNRDKFDCTEK